MNLSRTILLPITLLVAGCASVPDPLEGNYSEAFYPKQAQDQSVGANVRWGGTIIETRPEADRTCVEILAQPLDRRGQPVPSDDDRGRFLACRNEFIDPEIFVNGREVTTVGEVTTFRDGNVGEFNYTYPVVDADAVELWPDRPNGGYYGYGSYGYRPYGYGYRYSYRPYYRSSFYYGGFHHGGFIHR
mgnify:CR=1 FL=1